MRTLLRIDCSARITGSHTREIASYFEKQWKKKNPNGSILYRDLVSQPVPHLQNNTIIGFYTPIENRTPETIAATALSDTLIAELQAADDIVISSPLYNLNIPSSLKAYLDQIVRIGHTFKQTENGYAPLLKDKTGYIITAKGGTYKDTPMQAYDFQEPYLKVILGHIGIQTKAIFSVEGASDPMLLEDNTIKTKQQIETTFTN